MLLKVEQALKTLPYVTKQNLGLLLGKKKDATDYWVKKLVKEGVLIKLKNGFYAPRYYIDLVSQNPEDKTMYLEYLANVLRSPSYVSLEYILSKNNVAAEAAFALTSVTTKSTRTYKTELGTFTYRKINPQMFGGYASVQWRDKQVREATAKKALAELRYLNGNLDSSRYNNDTR